MDTSEYLCMTCGYFKTAEEFEEGDCTCKQCNAEGRSAINYDLDDDGNPVRKLQTGPKQNKMVGDDE